MFSELNVKKRNSGKHRSRYLWKGNLVVMVLMVFMRIHQNKESYHIYFQNACIEPVLLEAWAVRDKRSLSISCNLKSVECQFSVACCDDSFEIC